MSGRATAHLPAGFPPDAGRILVDLARTELGAYLGVDSGGPASTQGGPRADLDAVWLRDDGASFVTLTAQGRLRGCIGTLEAYRSLAEDVRGNAVSAAVRDPRFPAMTGDELTSTSIEVSVLSTPRPLEVATLDEALCALRPHVDGVVLTAGRHRGTFLPQVWEQVPDPRDFLDHLVVKARLPRGYWGDDVHLSTYTVTAWHELTPGGDVDLVDSPDRQH
ncbi:AmmeMemoRadiSam system protein A [Mobilicoccus massiliensis]|uniref:AmmeMemoRadiSam system protein A n=1 Tax=Mobilicoccus massiliensis TaxID=1522310 RepID=UPI000694EFFB|nr:AmmeMemoRadiSam system protein A [Mobilicoccus massiliensis]